MLSGLPQHSQTEVHFCTCGGARRKRALLKGTPTWLQALCRTCDGNHFHAPWKDSLGIHTAEEAAYPLPFCQAICKLLRDSLPPHSRPRPVFLGKALPQWRDDALFLRAAVKFQPRSWVFPNLPSPFDLQLFPQDLFDTSWFRGKRPPPVLGPSARCYHCTRPKLLRAACPKDPVHYMQAMNGVQHPANPLPPLGQTLEEAVDFVATCSTRDALSLWAVRLKSLLQLAEEFAPRQRRILALCDAHVARINAKKRTVLFKHALQSAGYQDAVIADELAARFPLYGWLPESLELPRHPQPPAVDIALARCQPTDDPAADQTLSDITLAELQQGWLDGPFLAPDASVLSPRFYVLQADKCRPIDDFTFNLLNSAVGSANKVVLHDTDFISALLKRCYGYTQVPWRGRAFDLQDAYRQLAIMPEHRAHSFICVYEPQHGPRCYRMLTMPFGSSASVYAFLRTSLAIHVLGTRLFRLPWTCFYDDFRAVVPEPLAHAATHLIRSLFTLLGFQVSGKPSRRLALPSTSHGPPLRGLRGGKH